jgi:hypothetical protein
MGLHDYARIISFLNRISGLSCTGRDFKKDLNVGEEVLYLACVLHRTCKTMSGRTNFRN